METVYDSSERENSRKLCPVLMEGGSMDEDQNENQGNSEGLMEEDQNASDGEEYYDRPTTLTRGIRRSRGRQRQERRGVIGESSTEDCIRRARQKQEGSFMTEQREEENPFATFARRLTGSSLRINEPSMEDETRRARQRQERRFMIGLGEEENPVANFARRLNGSSLRINEPSLEDETRRTNQRQEHRLMIEQREEEEEEENPFAIFTRRLNGRSSLWIKEPSLEDETGSSRHTQVLLSNFIRRKNKEVIMVPCKPFHLHVEIKYAEIINAQHHHVPSSYYVVGSIDPECVFQTPMNSKYFLFPTWNRSYDMMVHPSAMYLYLEVIEVNEFPDDVGSSNGETMVGRVRVKLPKSNYMVVCSQPLLQVVDEKEGYGGMKLGQKLHFEMCRADFAGV